MVYMNKKSDEEYHRTLPKKQVGTAVLFFNNDGEILVLKPSYKDSWLVSGGSCDEDESPLDCAVREVSEEIGLDFPSLKLVGVFHSHKNGIHSDSLKFVFYRGVLSDIQIEKITLQKEEILEYKFLQEKEAVGLMSNSLQKSVPDCLIAIKENSFAYIED